MDDAAKLTLDRPSTQTPRADGSDRYAVGLARWRDKAKRVDPMDIPGLGYWPAGDDPGDILRGFALEALLQDVGGRYRTAILDLFQVSCTEQREAVDAVRGYLNTLDGHVSAGEGLVFYGPLGTGKDFLAIGAGRVAVGMGYAVRWKSAQTIFADFVDSCYGDRGYSKSELMDDLVTPEILILSDPVPQMGTLTEFQANLLYQIVDARYRESRPTWLTLNATDGADVRQRIGPATVDRLSQGATVVFCSWPSFRRPEKSV